MEKLLLKKAINKNVTNIFNYNNYLMVKICEKKIRKTRSEWLRFAKFL